MPAGSLNHLGIRHVQFRNGIQNSGAMPNRSDSRQSEWIAVAGLIWSDIDWDGKRVLMSRRNGDKAQFGRLRKQKIARRVRMRELRKAITEKTGTDPLRRTS